ncbi:hypothetical protein CEXT_558271 [Caerostris extrusa]|uniref:Uncharacterized protein n=1 Tax=Caerostris extrusa TaxID=172846 RepID=A0AAV4WEW0_CAEEX|nr:hypothetical protein CEXT_558271 [Caerostris extrusa]
MDVKRRTHYANVLVKPKDIRPAETQVAHSFVACDSGGEHAGCHTEDHPNTTPVAEWTARDSSAPFTLRALSSHECPLLIGPADIFRHLLPPLSISRAISLIGWLTAKETCRPP